MGGKKGCLRNSFTFGCITNPTMTVKLKMLVLGSVVGAGLLLGSCKKDDPEPTPPPPPPPTKTENLSNKN